MDDAGDSDQMDVPLDETTDIMRASGLSTKHVWHNKGHHKSWKVKYARFGRETKKKTSQISDIV